jgi:hypothetical protein
MSRDVPLTLDICRVTTGEGVKPLVRSHFVSGGTPLPLSYPLRRLTRPPTTPKESSAIVAGSGALVETN